MDIYVITSGCYSGYTIEGVFLDKEKAEKTVEEHNKYYYDDWRIETFAENEVEPIETAGLYYVVKTGEVLPSIQFYKKYVFADINTCKYESMKEQVKEELGVEHISYNEYQRYYANHYFKQNQLKDLHKMETDFTDGVYYVRVNYNPDFEVMKKSVFDKIAAYKEYIKDFPEDWKTQKVKRSF